MTTVLFVCLHNAGRSQMSQALFQRIAGPGDCGLSAGTLADPGGHLDPVVLEVMREIGVDLAGHRPRRLTDEISQQADVVVTMGCGDACPYIPGKRYIDWNLPDPSGRTIDEVRQIRDEISALVETLAGELPHLSDHEQQGAA